MDWGLALSIGMPILASAITGLVLWYGRNRHLEGKLEQRDKYIEDRLRMLEERIRASDSGVLAQRVLHLELAIQAIEGWRNKDVGPYIPSIVDRIRDKLEAIEREIGTHDTGMRGGIHRTANKVMDLEGRVRELEQRYRRKPS